MRYINIFIATAFLFCSYTQVNAQLRHYLSLSTMVYADFFNHEKEPFGPMIKIAEDKRVALPELSYRIEKGRHSLEFYYSYYQRVFMRPLQYNAARSGYFDYIYRSTCNLNYLYNIYTSKHLNVSPLLGLSYVKQYALMYNYWEESGEPIVKNNKELSTLGLQTGISINAPIWKGIYACTNLRFSTIPWANDEIYRNYFMANIGLGYQFGRRK